MDIRLATQSDVPGIIELLKLGLGESRIPKSEEYWRWKHIENPFGVSFALVALDKNVIVGVRTFMCWKWRAGGEVIDSVRGVDTVVHPNYRGQGIFGKLTIQLADHCRALGYKFLFSTPNVRSRKGYGNIGWGQCAHLPVVIKIVHPLKVGINLLSAPQINNLPLADGSIDHYLDSGGIRQLLGLNASVYASKVITAHTVESLRWRYAKVPVTRYFAEGFEQGGSLKGLFFYRVKQSPGGTELRVTDVFVDCHDRIRDLHPLLRKKTMEHRADYVSSGSFVSRNMLDGGFSVALKRGGPQVTMVDLGLSHRSDFLGFTKWQPSFGDLELF